MLFSIGVTRTQPFIHQYSTYNRNLLQMNNFISAFYDAVLLYAIALNETIAEGLDPRNGHNITSKMWNRTFVGKNSLQRNAANTLSAYIYSLFQALREM